ncbi:ArsR/SmtB family transcription factor [Cohnella nanjingensis]|uniref:Winged helix-turn-helix transcriptional regulator n=1 Tax=Cohnella nanjingensis TaxID=1387779 RepID=A0A7X0RXW4_9BACL|nr:helix-turn-helix domain-containing protein [Cohnella nanjingensis]MBB6675590.1 winged helix-turn-helix transcriptional regulator [Cohnella nanjingensis]
MRTLYHPETKDIQLPAVLYALSDPIRLKLVSQLSEDAETDLELSCGELDMGVPKSTLSHHLKVLRESGITRTRLAGTQRFVTLRKGDLEGRFPGLLGAVTKAMAEDETKTTPDR